MPPDWYLTKDGDKSCLELYRRHYSAKKAYQDGRERFQFVGPGFSIVLRTARADAMFVWRKFIDDTIPKQDGVECSVFRNESQITSSKLVRQADAIADHAWPGERHYTKVNPEEVGSGYPGWCFIRAGWKRCGTTQGGLLIFERRPKVISRGEMLLDAIEEEVMQRLNPSGEDCPECGGDGYTYDCFEEFACVDPESGCADCARRCRWCAELKHDRLKAVREEVVKSDDVDIATAWLKQIGRWRDNVTPEQIKEQMAAERAKLLARPDHSEPASMGEQNG